MMGAKVALSPTAGSVLMIPMQLGPTIRIPEERTSSTIRSCTARPSAETSEKPEVITTTP